MAGRHHQLNEHERGQTPGDDEGQGSQVCCSHGVAKSRTRLKQLNTYNHMFVQCVLNKMNMYAVICRKKTKTSKH